MYPIIGPIKFYTLILFATLRKIAMALNILRKKKKKNNVVLLVPLELFGPRFVVAPI